ncbi:PspA/IM30 family protein [Cryobacterium sinapicolor]|uniref:PspA/IM30 family protein n=1 Tax=Cryobacterium sinapicolor TaxID=1259236 RepID=A0ABY2JEP8_9MICO|nr:MULTISPECIES: PspA/IM30 family protein [Cryobacterium]TFC86928.1 PspA/IM30 family protein [Cryobacterium sp. TMT3-29-2]TFD02286.1 PspA/IM30 family protein [Cryobacterium sinapicolor]
MSFSSRLRVILRSKSNRALTQLEDPREALDDSYEQQVKMLQQVRLGLAEVATAKKRIELQGQEMGGRYQRLADQAQEALNQGREDLARTALERRSLLEGQVAAIRNQYLALAQQQAQLQDNERRLAERIAAFRTEKETIKATYAASEARVKANEAAAGIGSQMGTVGTDLDRAKDRVAQMQARAAATDELLSSGALSDVTAAPDADLERQLSDGATRADVDRQLQAMKSARAADQGHGARARGGTDAWLSIGQAPTTP